MAKSGRDLAGSHDDYRPNYPTGHGILAGFVVGICLLFVGFVSGQEKTGTANPKSREAPRVAKPMEHDPRAPLGNEAKAVEAKGTGEAKAPETKTSGGPGRRAGFVDLILASGWIGFVIIFLSVACLALALDLAVTIRHAALIPPGLAQRLHGQITAGEFAEAEQTCRAVPCYLAYVVLAGLQEVRVNYQAVEKSMEDASQEQAARLFRKVEYLAVIGNIAPMLGLLGTVYGILLAFKKVAESGGAAVAADLADGVYLALVTTVEGLVVAIPALSLYALFRSRIEQFASEVNVLAENVFVNYKRGRMARRHGSAMEDAG